MSDKPSKLFDVVNSLLLEANADILYEFFHSEIKSSHSRWDDDATAEFKRKLVEINIKFELEDRYGGENKGSEYWSVYSFTDGMQVVFIKFNGWYASYDGGTYEEFCEVRPVEKTTIVFESV